VVELWVGRSWGRLTRGCAILARRRFGIGLRASCQPFAAETLRAFFPKLHDIPQNNITLIHDIQALAPSVSLALWLIASWCLKRLTLQRLKRWDRLIGSQTLRHGP